ncbi:ankyrin repeat domain-containing protein [Mariniblastus fucicola]|uniref:Phosphocholine transferase AnkX n=1 Tax=Mariniblastus fucicola TaxID=980251 RepID=A0A5B9P4W9_9BACT|nr:ankyrin repeat domain-containing protein [Mariniblastus fucicola]QEG21324.1 Phosphocholine transferase AnkX [Mariniblastus fucicola]
MIKVFKQLFVVAICIAFAPNAFTQAETSVADLAEQQDWAVLKEQLTSGSDVESSQPDGMTALHWAAYHNAPDTVHLLIEHEADVDAATEYAVTALSLAAERGFEDVVELLIEAKANVESKRLGKETPLMLAARNGNAAIVEALLSAGADPNAKEARGQTALMWAAAAGNVPAVDALIEGKADIDHSLSNSGFTAFAFAARQGKTRVIERLVEAGVDPNVVMETKRTGGRNPRKNMSALLLAIESGHFELALRLVELGADPNDQRSGYGPLHAISWVRKTKLGDDPAGDPAPRITGSVNSVEFVRRMVKAGADVNLKLANGKPNRHKVTAKGMTPFMFAASTADVPLMKLLLELGADPNQPNVDGCTPLMACAGVGVVAVGEEPGTEEEVDEAMRMLVKLGNDPNVVDANGETAMHGAAYRNYPSAVTVLTQLGADPNVWNRKNKHGWTPHSIAAGKRPGSLKPSPATTAALDAAMKKVNSHE